MKKIVIPFLCLLTTILSGCKKDIANEYFGQMPAIVKYQLGQVMLDTGVELYYAPTLADKPISEGDVLWLDLRINYDNQPSKEYITITEIRAYMIIDSNMPEETPGGKSTTDAYDIPITDVNIYPIRIGNYLIFFFQQKMTSDQLMFYEMTYASDEEGGIPTLYIRARKDNSGTGSEDYYNYPFAFNMTPYIEHYMGASEKIEIIFKYKTGVNEEGYDVYNNYLYNPLTWNNSSD